ncbi:MAG: zf-HC2 domain-containing protein [Clostridia bacterium]|nr:zf-HC2 domain-containing protein [Clostridia bacterium]
MSKLPCGVVRDLLPSYIDGLTNEETDALIEEHAASCAECRRMIDSLREPEVNSREEETAEIDFLKKNKRKTVKTAVAAACIAAAVAAVAVLLKLFVIGRDAGYEKLRSFVDVDGSRLFVTAEAADKDRAVSRLDVSEKEGDVVVSVRTVVKSFLHRGKLERTFEAPSEIGSVTVNGRRVYENGGYTAAFSEAMKQEVIANWKRYLDLPEIERTLWSTMPGYVYRSFETWQDASDFVGFNIGNPLENDPDFVGVDHRDYPGQVKPYTAHLAWYGDRSGDISYVSLEKFYKYGDLSVQFCAEPVCAKQGVDDGLVPICSTFGDDIPEGIVTSRDSGEHFSAANVIFMSDGVRYCIRIIDNVGSDPSVLEAAIETIRAVAEEMMK